MVNSEIGRGLYKAYRTDGQRVGLQWVYSGSTVGLQWVYSGSTVGLQWVYSGSTVGLQWVYNEQKTNKERRTEGEKVDLRGSY